LDTVYIDSIGGSIAIAERMRGLLSAPTPEGNSCWLITVVTGLAASAAADLLALGDYAIALPSSDIVYYGSRQQTRLPLTYELATSLATQIKEINERFALRLARDAFYRFAFRVTLFEDWLKDYKASHSPDTKTLIPVLRNKLTAKNRRLLSAAGQRQSGISELALHVFRRLKRGKQRLSGAQFEGLVLKSIVDFRVKSHSKDPRLISVGGLQEITSDFELFIDFHFGQHRSSIQRIINQFGSLFIPDDQQKALSKLSDETKRSEFLQKAAAPKLEHLWYLVVSICRILQAEDFTMNAEETYWLGLVDEVQGSDLPNLRELVESEQAPEEYPQKEA
jgi:hypothetical protein